MSLKRMMAPVDSALCSWDRKRTVNLAMSMNLVVMLGFFCGSSWYAWSILSFQFLLNGPFIVSSLLFAVVMSFMVWNYMVMVTFKFEYDELMNNTDRLTNTRRKRNQLLTLAGR